MLRTVSSDDASAIHGVVVAAGLFREEDRWFIEDMVSEHLTTGIENEHGFWVDIDDEGVVVGVVNWRPKHGANAVWDLTMIAIHPSIQGEGRGAALMAHAEQTLASADQRIILVETSSTPSYAPARSFYHSLGYAEEARIRDYWDDGDDLVLFRKRLGQV